MPDLNRREFLAGGAATVGSLALAARTSASGKPAPGTSARRPNLVFIFSDQQSYDMLGCYGNEQVITPHLDRFASQGMRFNHCVSSTPVCSPMRSMLFSGQHPLYSGVFTNDIQMLVDNGVYFGHALKNAGYQTAYVGKWHLYGGPRPRPIPRGPERYGFDDVFLSNNCTLDFRPGHAFYYDDSGQVVHFDEWEAYGQARQAAAFLDGCSAERPFALFLSMHPPHDQGITPGAMRYRTEPDLMALYDRDTIKLRPNVEDTPAVREDYHGHMAMCTGVDRAFGMVMDKLKAQGLDDNTLVVYTSDHGDLLSSHGRPWPKGFPEDESCRVPLIMRWPEKLPAYKTSDLLVGTLDLMPTLLGMMGLDIPSTCQGVNLAGDMLADRDDTVESVPLFHFLPGWRGVYTHQHTYTYDQFQGREKISWNVLYDRKQDPWQRTNGYGKGAHKSLQDRLHQMTQAWLDRFEDPFMGGYEILRLCGWQDPKFDRPGETGVLSGRPIDIIKAANTPKETSQ